MLNIIIFSKPIHSGKSTELLSFTKQQRNCTGILMPEKNGKKMFYDISSEKYFEAEIATSDVATLKTQTIGKYIFNDAAFQEANQVIINSFLNESKFIIIDEIGKLELRKEGFFESLQFILQSSSLKKNLSLLLVVRDSLLDEVINFFEIKEFDVVQDVQKIIRKNF